jgi:hypothetical protein
VVVGGLVVLGWLTRRRLGAIEAFVLSTAIVILVYAGAVTRFWIAALPFIIVYALFGAERLARNKVTRLALVGYAAAFLIAGAPSLFRTIATSTSGRQFPAHWAGKGSTQLAATYRVAFGEARPGDDLNVNRAMLELLRRHEPLARPPGK